MFATLLGKLVRKSGSPMRRPRSSTLLRVEALDQRAVPSAMTMDATPAIDADWAYSDRSGEEIPTLVGNRSGEEIPTLSSYDSSAIGEWTLTVPGEEIPQ